MTDRLLQRLRAEIGSAVEPVRPLRPSGFRVLGYVLVWVVLAVAVLLLFGSRPDRASLGTLGFWGLSLLQVGMGGLVCYAALRMTVPGGLLPRSVLMSFVVLALAVHGGVGRLTARTSFIPVPAGEELRMFLACIVFIGLISIPPAFLLFRQARRGLTAEPEIPALLAALGSSLAAEAAWRLHCPFSSWAHLLSSHTGGILLVTGIGLLIGRRLLRPPMRKG